jgi:hypothetical protein
LRGRIIGCWGHYTLVEYRAKPWSILWKPEISWVVPDSSKTTSFFKKGIHCACKTKKIHVNTSVEWLLEMAPNIWRFSWWVLKIYKHNSQKKSLSLILRVFKRLEPEVGWFWKCS